MKTALITGGSRGIGASLVRLLRNKGIQVAFTYHKSKDKALALATQTGANAFLCDVSNPDDVTALTSTLYRQYRHINYFIHCAGIANQALFHTLSDYDWHNMLNTNVSSAFYFSRAILPDMISEKNGRIILISSIWGEVGASMEVHYSTSKAALIGMTKALAKEVAPSGITVNCVSPGVIKTDMLNDFSSETLAQLAEETPVGRIGTAEEVSRAIYFLLEDESSFITGQVLSINGGFAQ